jgi:hypothetical protein
MDRRAYLGVLATGGLGAVAGCSEIAKSIADATLKDVNVSSGVEDPIRIAVTVANPGSETIFDRSASFESGGGMEQYEDVWETTGDHAVDASVAGSTEGDGTPRAASSVSETVSIPNRDAALIVGYETDGFEIEISDERS